MAEILISSNPKALSPNTYRTMLKNYLLEMQCSTIEFILLKSSGPEEHVSVPVSALDLIAFDSALAFNVLHYPGLLLPIFDEAVLECQRLMLNHRASFEKKRGVPTLKRNCHIRIRQIPPISQLTKANIGQIRSFEVDKLIQICGTIVRTGSIRMLHLYKEYECMNRKCGYRFRVCADPEQGYVLPQPRNCPGKITRREGDNEVTATCGGSNLREVEGSGEVIDYQEIKVQDQIQRLAMDSAASRPPRSILCILEADLVDSFNPGDDVVIVGTVVRRWRPLCAGSRCQVQCSIRANSVVKCHASDKILSTRHAALPFEQFWQRCRHPSPRTAGNSELHARNRIVGAVCPQLHGMFYVKLSLLLTLIGGSTAASMGSGPNRRRRDSHLLIVGDPGTGKSQLLRFASTMLPRAVLTTGVGTTGAGLTCSTVRSGGEWVVEAGALVLANEGVCCIDEFSCMKEQDRATIHEAMEQQTLSVAKAGLVVKLNTRCSIIAVTNPKGTYDLSSDLVTNTAIAAPLLSRFDLVLVLIDRPQKEWDKSISTYLLQQSCRRGGARQSLPSDRTERDGILGNSTWDVNTLRSYLLYVRERIQPVLGTPARQLLRQNDDIQSSRVTVRLLESLMRLAEAHAKLMHRDTVLLEDAVVAIYCMDLSSFSVRYSDVRSQSALYDDFPVDPDLEYAAIEKRVFTSLNCSRETLLRDLRDLESKGIVSQSHHIRGVESRSTGSTLALTVPKVPERSLTAPESSQAVLRDPEKSLTAPRVLARTLRESPKRKLEPESSRSGYDDIDSRGAKFCRLPAASIADKGATPVGQPEPSDAGVLCVSESFLKAVSAENELCRESVVSQPPSSADITNDGTSSRIWNCDKDISSLGDLLGTNDDDLAW